MGPNLGFALFLILLLLAPEIPVPGFKAEVSVSPGAVGLVIWLMLGARLPLRAVLKMPLVLALVIFSVYTLVVSMNAGSLVSIAYAAQYAFYGVLGGVLIPAYLLQRARQGRLGEVWRILAWIGGIYLVGLVVSLWTGPFYPYQVGMFEKHYEGIDIPRGVGFSGSANAAGGVAAVLAAFFLFLYRPSGRPKLMLAALSIAGVVATLSRSAILSTAVAMGLLVVLLVLQAVLVRGAVRMRVPILPAALISLGLVLGLVSFQQPLVAAAWERLFLDPSQTDQDVEARFEKWQNGITAWGTKPLVEKAIGSGFRASESVASTGAYMTAHSAYIEMLNDFGLLGLLMFTAILAVAFLASVVRLFVRPYDHPSRFCLVGLTALMIHNLTQVFFYDVAIVTLLILLFTCSELIRLFNKSMRAPRAWAAQSAAPAGAAGTVTPAATSLSARRLRLSEAVPRDGAR
jgi:O-antigen ligase